MAVNRNLSDDELLDIISKSLIVSIDIILQNNKGEILLGLRKNKPAQNFWFVPGGRIRKEESFKEAFRRIIRSELDIDKSLSDAEFLGVFIHNYPDNYLGVSEVTTRYVALAHRIHETSLLELKPDSQHHAFKWFNQNEIEQNNAVHPYTKIYFNIQPLDFKVVEFFASSDVNSTPSSA